MATHAITITYDDVTCEFTVSIPTLGITATGPTPENALAWACKAITDSPEE